MNDHATPLDGIRFFATSWDPEHLDFPADADFQTGIGDWILRGELDDPADDLMGGKPSPRIWLLLHEPGQGRLAAVTALALARELMGRDQAVLVLDCDEEQALLAGWAGRHEQEGWIDLVRYGASLLTCGSRLPFPGRMGLLLGPGSYRPVDAQPAEIEQLLGSLKRQADDILLCCPIGESGRAWAQQSDVRLLCWDLTTGAREHLENLVGGLAGSSTPLTGVVSFGEEPAPVAAGPDTEEEVLEVEPPVVEPIAEGPVGRTSPERPGDEPEPEDAEIDLAVEMIAPEDPVASGADLYARKRGTSRVFWWIALGAVALIAGSFWYYRAYVVVEPLGGEPLVAQNETAAGTPDGTISVDPGAAESIPPAGTRGDAEAPFAAAEAEQEREQETDAAGVQPEAQTEAGGSTATGPSDPESDPESGPESAPETTSGSTTEPASGPPAEEITGAPTEPAPAAPVFQMDPYLVPVGEDGWALHIYSFPDSQSAAKELANLHRRGFQTAVRTVQIKDKGRWERIYLGSFASKAEATEALEPLLKKLGEDWGRPTEF